jgi:LacI family transcriptional regulator
VCRSASPDGALKESDYRRRACGDNCRLTNGRNSRITSKDIAREAGVSQPTVSRALRGDPRVAPETAERVRTVARQLGYVPHAGARSMVTRRAGTVALVVADLINPFYPELVEVLRGELDTKGYRTVLLREPADIEDEDGIGTLVRSGLVDGVVLATARDDAATRTLLEAEGMPIVLVVREVDGGGRDAVVADNEAGAATAARLLSDLGHSRIAVISGPPDTSTALERERGFLAGLESQGITVAPDLRRRGEEFSHQVGHVFGGELLDLDPPPTALFCGNDVIALGALDAARGKGVAVPDQLSVIGFDDIAFAAWESFRLTTIHQPLAEMAAAAVGLVVERIEGSDAEPRRLVYPTHLVDRATVGPAP